MLTRLFGWIFPDADTTASRSRALMTSVVTDRPVSRLYQRLAATTAAPTRRTPSAMKIFRRFIYAPDNADRKAAITRAITR